MTFAPHDFKPTSLGICEVCAERKFHPSHHEYMENPTYSGPGCCFCGKPEEGHKPASKKVEKN